MVVGNRMAQWVIARLGIPILRFDSPQKKTSNTEKDNAGTLSLHYTYNTFKFPQFKNFLKTFASA